VAKCNFSFQLQGDPQAGFVTAKNAILKQGGTVQGDADSGSASIPSPVGKIALAYEVQGSELLVEVTDKPWVVTCTQIQDALEKALAQSPTKPKPTPPTPTSPSTPTSPQGGKVTVLDTQYIEGEVPEASHTLWYVVAGLTAFVVVGGIVWYRKKH
jgi:hypothetical protein